MSNESTTGYTEVGRRANNHDSTEHQQMQEELQRCAAIIESSHDAIISMDLAGNVVSWNQGAEKLYGYSAAESMGQGLPRLIAPNQAPDFAHSLETIRRGEAIPQFGTTRLAKDGRTVDVAVTLSPVKSATGQIVGVSSIERDISEQKQVEAALRIQRDVSRALSATDELHAALALILDAALRMESIDSGGIYLVDQSGALDLVVHHGLSPQFVADASHYAVDAPQARVVRDGQVRYGTYQGIRTQPNAADNTEGLHALAVIPVLHQGQLLAVLNLASHTHDVIPTNTRNTLETLALHIGSALRRLRADAELRTSRQNLRALFDTVDDFVFVLDGMGHILQVNAVVCERLGYSIEELAGQDVLCVHPPQRRAEAAAIIGEMLAGQRDFCAIPLQASNGTLIPVETHVVRGTWDDQPAIFGVTRDITEHQRQEEEIRRLNTTLEQQVAQLELALTALKRADQVKDEFLAAVSHELRTPLTSVLGMAETLELQYGSQFDERQHQYVRIIRENGSRLLALVNSILDYTAVIAAKVNVQPGPCRLANLCAASLHAIQSRAAQKGLEVAYVSEPADVELISDGNGITQVLHNLLDNAIKFTPAGGRIGLAVSGAQGAKRVQVVVWDTGIGIAPADQARIFKPFIQADSSLSRRYEGIGLGLSYARRMVELLGGTLVLESTLGEGCRFTVTLPDWNTTVATGTAH